MGMIGYVSLLALFGLAQNWIHLLLVRTLQGVVSAMVWPVAEAALMDIVGPERRGEGLGVYMMISRAGWILGPGLGGLLYNFARDFMFLPVPDVFRVPYFISAIICLPAVFLTAIILKETAPGKLGQFDKSEEEATVEEEEDKHLPVEEDVEIPDPELRKMIYALYAMSLFAGLAMGLGQPLFQLFLMSQITTDIGLIGALISFAGGIGMLFSLPAGWLSDRVGRKGIAVGGSVISRLSLGVLPLTRTIAETSAVWVVRSAAFSSADPAIRAIQADIVPWELRGKLFGTLQAFNNAGATIGPLAGGWIYGVLALLVFQFGPVTIPGYVLPFWISSIMGLFGAFLLWKYVKETRPKIVLEEPEESIEDFT
jgi:MFS family permease